jgi:hypothetical protein
MNSGIMGIIKLIFLCFAAHNFVFYRKLGHNNRKINKWSDSFCIKMLASMLMSINYSAMALVLHRCFCLYSFLWFVNSLIWIISVLLLYFEYRRKLPQSWIGLRLFWLLNGIFYYAKITYTVSYYNEDHYYQFIICSLVQSFLSTFLLYYSLFKARDFEFKNAFIDEIVVEDMQYNLEEGFHRRFDSLNRNEIQIAKYDEQGHIHVTNSGNHYKHVYHIPALLILSVSEIKFRRFSKQGDSLITRSIDDNFMENVKLRLAVTINLHIYKNKKPSIKKNENRNFVVKKSLREIINFNIEILTIFEQRIKVVSTLHIELKNITEIFRTFNSSKFKRRDMTLSDFDKSMIIEKKESDINYKYKIKNLETIYVNLCRNFDFFVPKLLKFLEVNDDYIISNVAKILEKNNSDFDYANKEWSMNKLIIGSNDESSHLESAKKEKNLKVTKTRNKDTYNEDFYSEIDIHNETDEYISKTMSYINSILTHDNYITLIITDLKERRNLIDSTIVAQLRLKKSNSKSQSIEINISFKNLLELVNLQKFKEFSKITELRSLIIDPKEVLKIKIKNSNYKLLLGAVFTKILNDLFYLGEEVFKIFELNKIIVDNIFRLIIFFIFSILRQTKSTI